MTTALPYMVLLVTMARITAMLLNIYETVKIKNKYTIQHVKTNSATQIVAIKHLLTYSNSPNR